MLYDFVNKRGMGDGGYGMPQKLSEGPSDREKRKVLGISPEQFDNEEEVVDFGRRNLES